MAKKLIEEQHKKKLLWKQALYEASLQNGDLRLSWQPQLRSIDSTLYDFFPRYRIHLRALRLIGVGLFEFPVQIGDVLTLLEILCLGNNDISIVPDNIVNLTHLRELSLLYNKLTHLPDRIGYLPSLQKLFLNNNRLAVLPATFGALNLLERVDLECNELTVLPENLASLVSCRSLNLNNNKLLRLPKCIGRMPSLTNLSASCNQLTYIPTEFSCSKTLEVLRLNKNQIKLIPDRIGDMTQLREIALDYNLIERVPVSFRALGNLKILRLEGNSLLEPPKEVVAGGAQFVVEFCRDSYKLNELGRMRQIITATQNILHQIVYYGLADPAYFEPEVQISGDEDPWCALDYPYLWSDAIPKLQQVWSALHRRRNRHRLEQIQQKTNFLLQFGYNEREVAWAYANYSDVYGPVMRRQKAMFRRCACLDSNGNRKPCVPPKVGFMCYSDCTLLKMRLLRTRDKEERVWNSYKAATVRDAVRRAEAESQAYLDSTEGRLWLEEAAYEHAEEVLIEKGTSSVVQKRLERVEDKKLEIIKKFDARKGKIQRVRDDKVSKLEIEINKLKESKAIAKEGYMKGAIERRIHDLTVRLASLPETQQLNDLQIECEDECERVEVALYEDDDSVATSELDSSEYSTDDESDEALRYRRMLQRRRANRIKREEAELARKQLKEETEEKRAAGINLDRTDAGTVDEIVHGLRQTINFAQKTVNRRLLRPYVEPTLEIVNKKVHKLKRKANRRMRIFFEIAKLRTEKIWRKFNGSFDEIQKEMKYEIYHQYINYHVTVAREKAQKEFHVIDQVRQTFVGLSLEKLFRAWRVWTLSKKQRERRDRRERWRTSVKAFDAAMESVRSALLQVQMWEEKKDIYSDKVYWQHSVYGDITYDRPSVRHYLPWNFEVPLPPEDLPTDFSLDTSSDESDGELIRAQEMQRQIASSTKKILRIEKIRQKVKHRNPRRRTLSSGSSRRGSLVSAEQNLPSINVERNTVFEGGEGNSEGSKDSKESLGEHDLSDGESTSSDETNGIEGCDKNFSPSTKNSSKDSVMWAADELNGGRSISMSQSISERGQSRDYSVRISLPTTKEAKETTQVIFLNSLVSPTSQPPVNISSMKRIDLYHYYNSVMKLEIFGPSKNAETARLLQDSETDIDKAKGQSHSQTALPVHLENNSFHIYNKGDNLSGDEILLDNTDDVSIVPFRNKARVSSAGNTARSMSTENVFFAYNPLTHQETTGNPPHITGLAESCIFPTKNDHGFSSHNEISSDNDFNDEAEGDSANAEKSIVSLQLEAAIANATAYMQQNPRYDESMSGIAQKSCNINTCDDVSNNFVSSDLTDVAAVVREKAAKEADDAYKIIRRKRNKLNPIRHQTYMHQLNRKPKSFEQLLKEKEQIAEQEIAELCANGDYFLEKEGSNNAYTDALTFSGVPKKVNFANATDEDLLRLAGGNLNMVQTGKEGIELRSILAQRALVIKQRLKDQAVEKGLVKPKRKSFWQREIKPIFGVYHGSSSDDEDDPKAVKAKEKAARKEARREKRNAKEQVEEKMRMFHEERSKEDARDIVTKTLDKLIEEN